MSELQAITDGQVEEVSSFLHRHLNRRIAGQAWSAALRVAQPDWADNRGFLLRVGSRVVGCYGAVYAEWPVAGVDERFCNLHSWCVLPEHRNESFDLVRALLRQRGLHFFNPTPNPLTVPIFEGLRFRHLDNAVAVLPTISGALRPARGGEVRVLDDAAAAELVASEARAWRAHRDCPWLDHLLLQGPGGGSYVAARRGRWRGVRAAEVLHVGDGEIFVRHLGTLSRWWLRHGVWVVRVERRLLPGAELRLVGTGQPRMVLSRTLADRDFSLLYTDLAVLAPARTGLEEAAPIG